MSPLPSVISVPCKKMALIQLWDLWTTNMKGAQTKMVFAAFCGKNLHYKFTGISYFTL